MGDRVGFIYVQVETYKLNRAALFCDMILGLQPCSQLVLAKTSSLQNGPEISDVNLCMTKLIVPAKFSFCYLEVHIESFAGSEAMLTF